MSTRLDERPDADERIQKEYDAEFNRLTSAENYSKTADRDELAEGEKGGLFKKDGDDDGKKKADSADSLASKETQASTNEAAGAEAAPGSTKGKRSFLTKIKEKRKQGLIGGGIVGIAITGIFGIGSIASGPFQLIHAGQLLQGFHFGRSESFGDDRSAKLLLYTLQGRTAQGRLSAIKNRNADKWEKRLNDTSGLRSVYSNDRLQRLIGYEVIDADKAKRFTDDAANNGIKTDSTFSGVDSKGNPISVTGADLRDTSARTRRVTTRIAVRSIGLNTVSSHLSSRTLFKRAAIDFHPLKNLVRRVGEKGLDYNKRQQAERAKRNETGSLDSGKTTGTEEEVKSERAKASDKIKNFTKAATGPALAVAAACAARDFSSAVDKTHLEDAQARMRLGMGIVTAASQVESSKDTNLDEVGSVVSTFYDEKTKTSLTDDNGMKHELGEEPNGVDAVPTDAKPGPVWPVFGFVGFITTPIAPACLALNWVSDLPPFQLASEIAKAPIDLILLPFGTSTEDLGKKAISFFAGSAPNMLAAGAELGGLANIGVREAVDSQMIAMGGTELTPAQANDTILAARSDQDYDFNQSTAYEKYLDIYNSRSAAATVLAKMPTNGSQLADTLTAFPSTLASSVSSVFGVGKVKAASTPYQYTFPLHGFTTAEMADTTYDDPYANEEVMLANNAELLNKMNTEYGTDCFDMQITPTGQMQYGVAKDASKIPDKCKDRSNADLTRYRFYIADVITATSLDCYEGNADSCTQIGFGTATATAAAPTTNIPTGPIVIGNTSDLTCSAGTDAGIGDGYAEGVLYKIRLCAVQGGTVNAQIASSVDKLMTDAKAAGVNLGLGDTFRTMAAQRATRAVNGCSGDSGPCSRKTASAGFSNHQMGLAIDFTYNGETICLDKSAATCAVLNNAGFNWLQANAAKYGLQNYPVEAWHWSYNGN